MENSMQVPQKIKNRTTVYDPVNPLLGIYLKVMKSQYQRDIYPHVYCSIIDNNQDVETA